MTRFGIQLAALKGAQTRATPGLSTSRLFGTGLAVGALSAGASAISAVLSQKEIERAAEENFKRIADFVTQARVDRILKTEQLAREAQIALGAARVGSPQGLSARETIASRIVAGVATDQFAIDEELRRRETAAKAEMSNIAAGANSQMASVASGVGQAFSGGMMSGMQLAQQAHAIDVAKQSQQSQAAIYGQQNAANAVQSQNLETDLGAAQDFNRYLLGRYNELYGRNQYVASSAGTQVGLRQIFGPAMGLLPSIDLATRSAPR